jgi:hypothetical protein
VDPAEITGLATAGVATALGGVLYLINLMRRLDMPACFEDSWGLASQVGPWAVMELLGRALLGPDGVAVAADPLWRALAKLDGRQLDVLPGTEYQNQGRGGLPAGWQLPDLTEEASSWRPAHSPLLAGIDPALEPWLALTIPSIYQRLVQDLALKRMEELPQALLLFEGRLFVSRSHVDLVLAMDQIAIPIRRAGLDANPGWLPAFGRVIAFHFN